MSILVTGGAGYIGSHVVRLLQERSEEVVVVDNLLTGDTSRLRGAELVSLDLARLESVEPLAAAIREHGVTSVIHLAALKQAGESVAEPVRYFRDNIGSVTTLLSAIEGTDVTRVVFSSSAAVYGNPAHAQVSEDAATNPINPYGQTKLAGEWLMAAAAAPLGIRTVSLRYFNVAGAGWPDLGDSFPLNLLTIAIDAISNGRRPKVFGTDFDTPDGTGVRDYVHVHDLASAHLAALDSLATRDGGVYNVGTGTGASVLEVLSELSKASGIDIDPERVARREGDPAAVVADVSRMRDELGWVASKTLPDMVASAWSAHEYRLARQGSTGISDRA